MSGAMPAVAVCIVTHGSAADLPGCLAAVAALAHRPLELVVVDCGSDDGSVELARELAPDGIPLRAIALAENLGFAGGMNAAIAASTAPFILTLNADARPEPGYVTQLLARLESRGARAGAATGRLVRLDPRDEREGGPGSVGSPAGGRLRPHPPITPFQAPVLGAQRSQDQEGAPCQLDACGMRLTSGWRHLDRGSGEADRGQYAAAERVFGATGAASLFRRAALADVAWGAGEIFDPLFHSFREDAELAFRLCERGWEVLYEPAAVAFHRRFNLPERRAAMPPAVNFHSLKNRYLLRCYHQTARNFVLTLAPTLLRDAMALGYVVLRERSSLAAYAWLWRNRRTIAARRRQVAARRTAPAAALDRWFFRDGEPL